MARLTVHAEVLSDYKMAFEAVQWVKTAQVRTRAEAQGQCAARGGARPMLPCTAEVGA